MADESTENQEATKTGDAGGEATEQKAPENQDADKETKQPTLADAAEGAEKEGEKDGEKTDAEGKDKGEGEDAPKVPESPDQYDFTIPEDLGLKDEKGDPLQFTADDPLVAEARQLFHDSKIPQEAASKMVGLYARAVKETQEATLKSINELSQSKIDEGLKKLETKDAEGKTVEGGVRVQRVLAGIDAAFGEGASKIIGKELTQPETVIELERWLSVINEGEVGSPKDDAKPKTAAERMYGG